MTYRRSGGGWGLRQKILILLLLVTAAGCNRTHYSYFEKKQACSRFLTDKQLRENTFGDTGQNLSTLPAQLTPVVFYSTSLDTCIAVVKAEAIPPNPWRKPTKETSGARPDKTPIFVSGEITVNGKPLIGTGRTFDLLTGMVLDTIPLTEVNGSDFTRYQREMMKRYEAAE